MKIPTAIKMASIRYAGHPTPDIGNMMGMMREMVKSGDQSGLPGLAGMVGLAGDLSKSDNPMKTITMGMLKTQTPFFIGHTHFCTTHLGIW